MKRSPIRIAPGGKPSAAEICATARRWRALETDPTKLADLAASLKANDDALAAAVAANTPAAPPATT